MTDLNKLIAKLELLDFKRDDFSGMISYTRTYNDSEYIFRYYTDVENNVDGTIDIYKINKNHEKHGLKNYVIALDILNVEFKAEIRKLKISKLL